MKIEIPKNGKQFFLDGLETILNQEQFDKARTAVEEEAFDRVFDNQDKGKLVWKRVGEDLEDFTSELAVKNSKGEEIVVPVYFYFSVDSEGFRSAYLTLVSKKDSYCRNDYDHRVKRLYEQITGKVFRSDVCSQ